MTECIGDYFILNGEIKNCDEFQEKYIKEGKALYEVIRIINGVPLYLERHLQRLENTADLTKCKLWLNINEIQDSINKLIKESKTNYGNVKIIFNFGEENNFLVYFLKHSYPTEEMYDKGVKTIIYHGERTNPNAKVIDVDFRSKVTSQMEKAKAYEAILVDRDGYITEGSKSNIFMIKDKKVITSPIENVLPGVTRAVIIEICKELELDIVEEKVHYTEIKNLDALFISGTSPRVLPINFVDNLGFNSSQNCVLKLIKDKYNKNMEKYIIEKCNHNNKD